MDVEGAESFMCLRPSANIVPAFPVYPSRRYVSASVEYKGMISSRFFERCNFSLRWRCKACTRKRGNDLKSKKSFRSSKSADS